MNDSDAAAGVESGGPRPRLSHVDWALLVWTLGILIAYSSVLSDPTRTIRIALLLATLVPGLMSLVATAARREPAAIAASAFLAIAGASTIFGGSPWNSLFGVYSDSAYLYLIGYFAVWQCGRLMSPEGRRRLVHVILAGVLANCLVGLMEVAADITRWIPTVAPGRAAGLTGNPVFLGGLLLGALPMAVAELQYVRTRAAQVALALITAVFAATSNLTGSRISLVGAVGLAVLVLARLPARSRLIAAGAIAVGLFGSALLPDATTVGDRVASGSGFQSRLLAWEAGAEGLLGQPLLGFGPGRFKAASGPHLSSQFPAAEAPDTLFSSAHNILVEVAVGTGVLGLAAFLLWVFVACRRCRGPLAIFALGVSMSFLLQPVTMVAAAPLMLAVGASSPKPPAIPWPRWATLLSMGAATVGLTLGVCFIASDYLFAQGYVETAARLRPASSDFAVRRATAARLRASQTATLNDRGAALRYARAAAAIDPFSTEAWQELARAEGSWGSAEKSQAAFERALELYPWSENSLLGLQTVATYRGDTRALARAGESLCVIRSDACADQ